MKMPLMVYCKNKKTALAKVIICSSFLNLLFIFLLGYPDECSSVDAPVSIECMDAIWLSERCIAEGSHYPGNLTGADRTDLDSLTVQYIVKIFVIYSFYVVVL